MVGLGFLRLPLAEFGLSVPRRTRWEFTPKHVALEKVRLYRRSVTSERSNLSRPILGQRRIQQLGNAWHVMCRGRT